MQAAPSSSVGNIRSFRDLDVYAAAMEIFERTKEFPKEETYAMVDQMHRSSRSVCANSAEAWRRRRSADYFRLKLGDAEREAAETRVWIEFAYRCEYLTADVVQDLDHQYDQIVGQRVHMIANAEDWKIRE
ncbi:four helix bundle protein [Salinibacter altiplanensis]|uniref:four helix bundle protein n=1 Tax=Salinibacter altiplanensis TaxID=1803181 RepID=UPI000C9F4145|nr:four helix bundle protein [Salinibacter altiplanensis]